MESSWCKSSPVKAVAGRPAASVAIRRVTGGCEAYTARKQAARVQLRKRLVVANADAVSLSEGSMRHTDNARLAVIAGVPSPGHAFKETPREPRRAPYLSRNMGVSVQPNPNRTRSRRGRELPGGEANITLDEENPATKGDRRRQVWVGERSYEPIVPMKAENRCSDASCRSSGWKSRRWESSSCHRSYTRRRGG